MQTRFGIELDINQSEISFSALGFIFYFTSNVYLNKFKSKYNEYVEIENLKINNKYKINVNMRPYLMISFYQSIEKRGFRIEYTNDNEIINIKKYDYFIVERISDGRFKNKMAE